ncbi:cobalamin B12-binding domain-containing protein [Jeotgalibacillus proteolyticus]|uniref:cobalamin B12-binding domain-containing protein n=1 Tax=Jeotgalibacillus proteolyticus TaxID=2082395 RepID=UPI001FD6633A|nr:cobalamin B12-binding domain-containing protein [Jeotgalibacillus proteolyticus]
MYCPKELAGYFLEGNTVKAWKYINEQEKLTLLDTYHAMITPAMQHIGYLWETNEISVADEHLATVTCDYVVSRLAHARLASPEKNNRKAMFLCLEGEQHYIGLKMVNSLFEEMGWDTKYYGANLPVEYILKTAEAWQPAVVGLSVSIVYHLPKLKEYIEELSKLPNPPVVIVGGRLTEKYDLKPYCSENTIILKDLKEMREWLNYEQTKSKQDAAL